MLILRQWEDFNLAITVRQPSASDGTLGTVIDLTGASAIGFVFKGFTNETRYPVNFVFADDLTTGQLVAGLSAAEVGQIPYGLYLIHLKVIDSQGRVLHLFDDVADVLAGVPNE